MIDTVVITIYIGKVKLSLVRQSARVHLTKGHVSEHSDCPKNRTAMKKSVFYRSYFTIIYFLSEITLQKLESIMGSSFERQLKVGLIESLINQQEFMEYHCRRQVAL